MAMTMGLLNIIKAWRTIRLICFIFIIIYVKLVAVGKNLLSESVAYYEYLDYPQPSFPHTRVRKSLNSSDVLRLDFSAHGRTFKLGLKKDSSLFSDNLLIADNIEKFQTSNIYEGKLIDEPSSFVHGFVHDNIFEGRIRCNDGNEYQVESAKQYDIFDKKRAHSIIYNIKDVIHSKPYYSGAVDIDPDLETMSFETEPDIRGSNKYSIKRTRIDLLPSSNAKMKIKYNSDDKRFKRAVESMSKPRKLACQIHIRADPTYVKYAKGDKNRAMYMMSQHVKFVNNMLESSDFDGDGVADGYSLAIKRIGVIDTTGCTVNSTSMNCKFSTNKQVGVAKFLDLVSTEDHSAYCLSYVFTHRNFDNGILGLAFTGSASGKYPGGICETYKSFDGKKKTLNTGVVSNTVYEREVTKKVTDITFAHEISHSFGSRHDNKNNHECVPNGENGNYLMFSQAQYGTDKNNVALSPCSRAAIWKTLLAKSDKCFQEKGKPICGNRIVEPGEDCDCGYATEDSCYKGDQCCQGASHDGYFGCKFSNMARKVPVERRCSPSQGPCCNPDTCQPYPNNTKECSKTDDCEKVSKCISTSYQCQRPVVVLERRFCNDGNNICINGKCSGSLCLLANKVDCQCADENSQCKVCCQTKGNASSCEVYKLNGRFKKRQTGSPCNQGNGRCNILSKCQSLNEDGILWRLQKWLFSKPSFVNIYEWAKVNWWACVLMGLALILFIIGFVWCCKQFVPSDGKGKRKPARPFLCINPIPEGTERPRSPSAPSNTSSRNYIRTPSSDPPHYDDAPPGYNTALRDNIRYPPSYELEIRR